jgi:putative transposase
MPRKARIDAPGALHHIILRGIERKRIFQDDTDRDNFRVRVGTLVSETATACYAWALLSNHVHLLLRTGTVPISTVMRRLLTGYALSYNRRHRRHGHLFQNRYKSILCQEDPYFLELVRYIHLNPLRARAVKNLADLDTYPYSGHCVLVGKREHGWQDSEYVLAYFGGGVDRARRQYKAYVQEGIAHGRRPELVGGGLIRSVGGWSGLKKLSKGLERIKGDERILGDSDFVREVLGSAEEHYERTYRLKSQGYDVARLAKRVADIFEMEAEEVCSAGKYRKTVKARSVFCYWATRELGESATSLGRMLGLSQPAVSISVKRGEKIVKEMGIEMLNE